MSRTEKKTTADEPGTFKARNRLTQTWVPKDVKAAIKMIARMHGQTEADWNRHVIVRAVRRELKRLGINWHRLTFRHGVCFIRRYDDVHSRT